MTQEQQVIEMMRKAGGYATLRRLNEIVDYSAWKTKTPEATIRRIVQVSKQFFRIQPGLWALDKEKEFSVTINDEDLSNFASRYYEAGSFELYPTKNMYQFILLNKEDGRKWHVQWGIESNKRWIRRIY